MEEKVMRVTLRVWMTTCAVLAAWPAWSQDVISVDLLDTYTNGVFDESAAEIGDFDPITQRFFVVNGDSGAIDVLNMSDPSNLTYAFSIDVSPYGDGANSVAVKNGVVAAAVEADDTQDPGQAVFFDTQGAFLNAVTVGALPDMIIFTPNGQSVLVACEGEPNDDYDDDPEGVIAIIDISGGVGSATVTLAGFTAFNGAPLDPSIRIFGPGATVAQDLEPEYIAVSADSTTAWVTCQENNALAVVDLSTATVTDLVGLGFKDHSLAANALDASDRDSAINIASWPVWGMYQPDAIVAFQHSGQTYLISANEGDARDYDGLEEEERIKDLTLDPTAFPNAATLQEDENIGRLTVTTTLGDVDTDGDYDQLYSFGARSFTIWSATGGLLWDSGDALEQMTATYFPDDFNCDNDENDSFDTRSDAKGPEPEGVEVGEVNGIRFAFVGLERIGGFAVYDISNPNSPVFVDFINNRDFDGDANLGTAGDLGPEGMKFIPAADSPNGRALLVVTNEVSGSTSVYDVKICQEPAIVDVAPVGQNGITIEGTPGCTYEVTVTDSQGNTDVHPVTCNDNGLGFLNITVPADASISVGQEGAAPSDSQVTVPTLGFWSLLGFSALLLSAGLFTARKRPARAA